QEQARTRQSQRSQPRADAPVLCVQSVTPSSGRRAGGISFSSSPVLGFNGVGRMLLGWIPARFSHVYLIPAFFPRPTSWPWARRTWVRGSSRVGLTRRFMLSPARRISATFIAFHYADQGVLKRAATTQF